MAEQIKAAQERKIRILRRHEVERLVGLSRSAIYRRIADGTFCRPVPLGADGKAVGWIESEINDWLSACVAQRDRTA
jgi:prophage regulatory protein